MEYSSFLVLSRAARGRVFKSRGYFAKFSNSNYSSRKRCIFFSFLNYVSF